MTILRSKPERGPLSKFGLCVIESHHSPDFSMNWGTTEDFIIVYVLTGGGYLCTREHRYPLERGRTILIPKATEYQISDTPGNPLSLYLLGINNPELEGLCGELNLKMIRVTMHKPTCHRIRNLLQDIFYEQTMRRQGADARMASLMLEILVTLLRCRSENATPPDATQCKESLSRARVAAYVEEVTNHFYRQQTLAEVAASTGLHVRYFSLLFRQITGMTWLRFMQQKRIQHAKRLLRESNRSILSVCFECGFQEFSTFYRTFQKLEGVGPKAWRESA